MHFKRREFLQIGSLATASVMMPKFLKAFEKPAMVPAGNKVVVVLQFSGGNDGLNTVIPVSNDIYYKERRVIGIKKENALSLTDAASLHPSLEAFKGLYDDGNLGILNAVGYPNPDRSHFRSMDIWQSASATIEWNTVNKIFANTARPKLSEAIIDSLLQTKGRIDGALLANYLNNESRESFIKSVVINVMSTPEYQLC